MVSSAKFEEVLNYFDVVSFDIFDTLLIRPFIDPNDLYRKIGLIHNRRFFAFFRSWAQRVAQRKAGERDPSLDGIYSLIPRYGNLKKIELNLRSKTLYGNCELIKLLRFAAKQGKKILIISDMYLSSAYLKEILMQQGVSHWDGFYVSNEHNGRKSNGKLYEEILRELNVKPEKVLHIGDNRRADVLQANKQGMVAYLYPRVADKFICENPFVRRFLSERNSISRRFIVGALACGWHLFEGKESLGYWGKIGFLYGGVLGYAYASFVGREARRRGIKRLLLVYRDGYNLEPIFNKLFPELKTTLLYAPRKTYFYAYKDFTSEPHMIQARRKMVWRELGMSGDEQTFLDTGILSKENEEKFDCASKRTKSEYVAYLNSLSIDNVSEVALVDMTTSALSATKLLEKTLGETVTSFYLLAYKPALPKLPLSIVPMFHAHGSSIIFTLMSEFLFSAPTPSVVGVENGQPVYDKSSGFFDIFKANICRKIRPAILAGAYSLAESGVEISPGDMVDYFEAFHAAVTTCDESEFSFAIEATGIEQKNGRSPLQKGLRRKRPVLKLLGRVVLSARVWTNQMRRYVTIYLFGRMPILRIRLPF